MSIRFATAEDIPTLVDIGRVYQQESRFKRYRYNPEKLRLNLENLVANTSGSHCFFVADNAKREPYALLIGCIETYFFSDEPVAQSILFWVHPEHRGGSAAVKLMQAFRKWAMNRNAFEVAIGVNSAVHIDKADQFFRKLGFQITGGNYSLNLSASTVTPE
jgi:GNAT superfamily N-acetyltransferase